MGYGDGRWWKERHPGGRMEIERACRPRGSARLRDEARLALGKHVHNGARQRLPPLHFHLHRQRLIAVLPRKCPGATELAGFTLFSHGRLGYCNDICCCTRTTTAAATVALVFKAIVISMHHASCPSTSQLRRTTAATPSFKIACHSRTLRTPA